MTLLYLVMLAASLTLFSASAESNPRPAVDAMRYVRDILNTQQALLVGDEDGLEAHRRAIRAVSEAFRSSDNIQWSDPPNRRALLLFAFLGGDPRVAMRVLINHKVKLHDDHLMTGLLALAENAPGKAIDSLLAGRRAISDPLLSAALALTAATLLPKNQHKIAIRLLSEARLEAPGTLIEETALRGEILLVLRHGELKNVSLLIKRYLRRFPRSHFAPSLYEQASRDIVDGLAASAVPAVTSMLDGFGDTIAARSLRATVCRELLLAGHLEAAAHQAQRVARSDGPDPRPDARQRLCVAAARVFDPGAQRRLEDITRSDASSLGPRDQHLFELALHSARQLDAIRPTPAQIPDPVPTVTSDQTEAPADLMARARDALRDVDAIWTKASQ